MKKLLFLAVIAVMATCVVSCGDYKLSLANEYNPYFFNARNLDLNYRIEYYLQKSMMDSINKDTTKIMFTPWVPYGYQYPY